MANAPGHSGEGQSEGAQPDYARSWAWKDNSSGVTTGEYGDLSWDNTVEIEPTLEDRGPTGSLKKEPSFSPTLSQIQGIEESGDFDLTPLRHLLEQDWADPGTERSKADYRPQSASGSWYAAGSSAEAETMEVKTVEQPTATVAALPSEADFPDLVMAQRPSGPAARPIAPPPPKPGKPHHRLLLAGGVFAVLAILSMPFFKPKEGEQISVDSKPPVQAAAGSVNPIELDSSSAHSEPDVAAVSLVESAPAPQAPSSVELDWTGVPEGSKVFWQGAKTSLSELGAAPVGKYDVKVFAPSRPVVRLSLNISAGQSGPVFVGRQVKEALARQPVLTVSLAKAPGKAVQVKVRELGEGATFKAATKLEGAAGAGIVLPKPGKYKVEVAETATHQAYGQTVTIDSGGKKSVQIALKAAPPRVVSAPAAPSYSGSSGYSEPAYYPPPRSYGGGGGGGSRIAPPSF